MASMNWNPGYGGAQGEGSWHTGTLQQNSHRSYLDLQQNIRGQNRAEKQQNVTAIVSQLEAQNLHHFYVLRPLQSAVQLS